MSFLKKNRKMLLIVSFSCFMLLQQIAIRYRENRSSTAEMIDVDWNDKVALFEIHQLEKLWRQADVEDLVTSKKMANFEELKQARIRLKQAEIGIRASEKRVQATQGKRREFFQKAHAYYHHSISLLTDVIDFLLRKQGAYLVKGNEIIFESDSDADSFRNLVEQFSLLHQEKEDLDVFIINYNREVEKKLFLR